MTRKNKVMLAAAVAALALLVGSGVARCSLAHEDIEEAESATEAIEQVEGAQERSEQETGSADSKRGDSNTLEGLVGTSWVGTDDPARTLAIVEGAFVEGADGQNAVTYWTLDSEEDAGGTLTATVLASKSMSEAASPTLVTVSQAGGVTCIRSDALACEYKQVQPGAHALQFAGITGELADSMGVEASKIEAAVSSRAASVSPTARAATWDKEVWIDYAGGTATTSFTLNDGASTLVSVTRNADGTVEAL